MVVNTIIPPRLVGSVKPIITGKRVYVPLAQFGWHLLTLSVAFPVAPIPAQLVHEMELRYSLLVAQPMKISPGRMLGTLAPAMSCSQGGAPGSTETPDVEVVAIVEGAVAELDEPLVLDVDGSEDGRGELLQLARAKPRATAAAATALRIVALLPSGILSAHPDSVH